MGSSARDKQRERCRCEAGPQGGIIGPSEDIACNQRTCGGSDDGSDGGGVHIAIKFAVDNTPGSGSDDGSDGGGVHIAIKCAVDNTPGSGRDDGGDHTEGGGTSAGGSESVGDCGISHGGAGVIEGGAKGEGPHSPRDGQGAPLEALDGGWGWMVALGTALVMTLLPSVGPCFGVLFSEYLLEHGTSSTTTAWIFNTQGFAWNLSGLLTRPLSQELGWQKVGLLGSVISASGLIISAFAPSPGFLFFSFSLLTGIGGGLVTALCFTILPHYFNRKRGLANAIMMAGVCMGQMVGPPVARLLQDEYGYKGATMILGAILLNACVGASLFQPPERHMKPCTKLEKAKEEEEGEKPLVSKDYKLDITRVLLHSDSNLHRAESSPGDLESHLSGVIVRSQVSKLKAGRRFSGASYVSTISISSLEVAGIGVLPVEAEEEKEEAKGNSSGVCSVICRLVRSIITDLGVLRLSRACIVCFGGMMCINGYLNFMMMVPFAMVSSGHSLDTAAWCLSMSAVCNLVMRILVSSLSDARWFKIRLVYKTGFLVVSASMFAFPLVQSASGLLVTMAAFGCGLGSNMGIFNLVMIDVLGVDLLAPVFGTCCLCVAVGFICLGPLIGFIRDWSGSYAVSIWVISFMLFLGFLSWLLMPLATRYDQRRSRRQAEKGGGHTR